MGYRTIAEGRARPFEISGGLREGYDGELHSLDEVLAAHHAWQRADLDILGVRISPATFSWGRPEQGDVVGDSEPGFIISGSINVLYDARVADMDAEDRIFRLAAHLGAALGQQRLYVQWLGQDYIWERE